MFVRWFFNCNLYHTNFAIDLLRKYWYTIYSPADTETQHERTIRLQTRKATRGTCQSQAGSTF